MNRIFKRKLVFVEVCSPFSFIRFTNTEKNLKKKKDVRRSLSWVRVLQVLVLQVRVLLVRFLLVPVLQVCVLQVQSSPVHEIQYAWSDRVSGLL